MMIALNKQLVKVYGQNFYIFISEIERFTSGLKLKVGEQERVVQ